ncbi:fused MFS/spermidine synthase [Spongiactinospora sp. TRM90649]|uniref:spermidine synthase n=1 Tax=Spongiactinospora sp. TRM90649 TaxID=3031114 RepID=UPI0023FA228E|nr:fused MFS/spermidine synthase [Spongiactinospora sp. TRM90649]MDF5757241.1 fused MFS/spermidine synthase [Spongiactinospora sp. TRM90649]
MARRTARDPEPGRYAVSYGEVELLRDLDRPNGWILTCEGVPQSYVDLDDPLYLDFEYVRLMADVIDLLDEGPLDAVHVGGGACTIPRYVAASRPGSRQIVAERDAALVQLVRDQLRLKSVPRLKVRIDDGRAAVAGIWDDSADLVVLDAFTGAVMPVELATVEYLGDLARILRHRGTLLVNLADGKGLGFVRRFAATVIETFRHAALLADPGVMRGRRFGNLILAASRVELPVDALVRRAAGGLTQARCVHGEALTRFVAGAAPIRDGQAVITPVPPPAVFGS